MTESGMSSAAQTGMTLLLAIGSAHFETAQCLDLVQTQMRHPWDGHRYIKLLGFVRQGRPGPITLRLKAPVKLAV